MNWTEIIVCGIVAWLVAAGRGGVLLGRWLRACRRARDARHAAPQLPRRAAGGRSWESIPFTPVKGRPPWPPADPPSEWTEAELAALAGEGPVFAHPDGERFESFGEWRDRMEADIAGWQCEGWAS